MTQRHLVQMLLTAAGLALLVLGVLRHRDDALSSANVTLALGCLALLGAYLIAKHQGHPPHTGSQTTTRRDRTAFGLAGLGLLFAVLGLVLHAAGASVLLANAAAYFGGFNLVLAVVWVQVRT